MYFTQVKIILDILVLIYQLLGLQFLKLLFVTHFLFEVCKNDTSISSFQSCIIWLESFPLAIKLVLVLLQYLDPKLLYKMHMQVSKFFAAQI